ncbi:MAG: MOSC domain-containing protein YiiM [Granulosicoccus sp.]|jgi:MOSC domain-containing protein YiiM
MITMQTLMNTLPQQGIVTWLGVRPGRDELMQQPDEVEARSGSGLTGDRFKASRTLREVTLIQAEHIDAIASMMGENEISPAVLRRNIVVKGLNLLALKGHTFSVGHVQFRFTGLAHPCSKMERHLGPGGYNAMRGHGGITASILQNGIIRLGDPVTLDE